MDQPTKTSSRKKFLTWGITALSAFTLLKNFSGTKKEIEKKETIKMLTQDGKLVEIDADKIYSSKREMISDKQLKNWITKKKI
jgi:hypothetical protein